MNKINGLCAVIATWLNASQKNLVGVRMNRSDREVKHFKQSYELDTVLYKNVPLPL